MSSSAAEAPLTFSEYERDAYFKAREKEEKDIGRLILQKLIEEEKDPANHPRRILLEVAVESGYPLQIAQRVFWTLETRGQIRWEHGHFIPVEQGETG